MMENNNRIATEEEKKSLIQKIIDCIMRGLLEWKKAGHPNYATVEESAHQLVEAVKKLDDVENMPLETLEGMYEISKTLEGSLKEGNLEKCSELFKKLYKEADDIYKKSFENTLITIKDVNEAVTSTLKAKDSSLKNIDIKKCLDTAQVFRSTDSKNDVYVLLNVDGHEYVRQAKLERDGSDKIRLSALGESFNYLESSKDGKLELYKGNKDSNHDCIMVLEPVSFNISSKESTKEDFLNQLKHALAEKEGLKVYDEKMKFLTREDKFIMEHYQKIVEDPNTGTQTAALTDEKNQCSFRVYDKEAHSLVEFSGSPISVRLYNDVDNIEADVSDKSGLEIGRLEDIKTDFGNKKIRSTFAYPAGDTTVRTMFENPNVDCFLATLGLDENARKAIFEIGKNDGWKVNKEKALVNEKAVQSFKGTIQKYAQAYLDDTSSGVFQISSYRERKFSLSGDTIVSMETPAGNEFQLKINRHGEPAEMAYREAGAETAKTVYYPMQNTYAIPTERFKGMLKFDKDFSNSFKVFTQAIADHFNNNKDISADPAFIKAERAKADERNISDSKDTIDMEL